MMKKSVGVNVNITHMAATLENDVAISTATFCWNGRETL